MGTKRYGKPDKETGNKEQRYKCKNCGRKFITDLQYSKEFKSKAIEIFYEGNSGRAVGRIMGINKSTVCNWIKELSKKENNVEEADDKITKEIIEMDELYTYVESKKNKLS